MKEASGAPDLWHTYLPRCSPYMVVGAFLLLAFAVAPPAFAAPIDDANAAYQRGNYPAAEKILLPIAEAGNA